MTEITNHELLSDESRKFAEELVVVHMTDYHPENGFIRTTADSTRGSRLYLPRHTIHTSLNRPVTQVNGGTSSWDDKRYAVIAPFNGVIMGGKNNLASLNFVDTYF